MPGSRSPTSAGCAKSRTGWRRRSWRRCATPNCASCMARACGVACCSTGLRLRQDVHRAGAGRRIGAGSISVGLADILDMYVGSSERNIAELFGLARREAPCALFLDEIDALGQKRSSAHNAAMRGAVVQLLTELDGVAGQNEGVFVLAATNQPWDVDPALRRPGRLDRTLLVLPPDAEARQAVFRYHMRHRPVEAIDLRRLGKATDGFSGADIAHVCETASERALIDSARSGQARLIGMPDVEAALREVRPSIGAWRETARNVVLFADADGTYAELRNYMKKAKRYERQRVRRRPGWCADAGRTPAGDPPAAGGAARSGTPSWRRIPRTCPRCVWRRGPNSISVSRTGHANWPLGRQQRSRMRSTRCGCWRCRWIRWVDPRACDVRSGGRRQRA